MACPNELATRRFDLTPSGHPQWEPTDEACPVRGNASLFRSKLQANFVVQIKLRVAS